MNRDETIALFAACEAARAAAKQAALADRKPEDEAHGIAHEAAKAIWNGWAEPLLAERKQMEEDGCTTAERARWAANAKADFTRIHFQTTSSLRPRGAAEAGSNPAISEELDRHGADAPRDDEKGDSAVKTLSVEGGIVIFSGFKFPGDASFARATFSGGASFGDAAFSGDALFDGAVFSYTTSFRSAKFSGNASFDRATFSGDASFASTAFSGDASFHSVTFSYLAVFASATFSGDASFESATFSEEASFENATFSRIQSPSK